MFWYFFKFCWPCISVYLIKIKVKWSLYRPGFVQRVGRRIALLFHDRDTRSGWVVSSTPRSQFTPGKDPVPIIQEAGWALGPVWTGAKSRPHRDSIPDRAPRSQSLYRRSYRAHSEYLILTAYPLQQWLLQKFASMLRLYVHCLSCVSFALCR